MSRAAAAAVLLVLAAGPAAAVEWPTYAGGPRRLFFNPLETQVTPATVANLRVKWRFRTGAVVTASPAIVTVDLPGEGPTQVAFIPSWDYTLYALRLRDGSEVWRFATPEKPVSYPNVSSVSVDVIDGVQRVHFASGQTMYSVDARTGSELWRFNAGTGCLDPPGLCGFRGERNEIESSPLVADGKVFFGMDVNDREGGKGGFYAVDARDGRLAWFFDLESGMTCRPDPGDDIRRYDGYHSEEELGLPAGFLATRSGCDHPRSPNGCGNVWSSPALDEGRGRLFVASSNCDTDDNPESLRPAPPMPPYDEAIFALALDGTPAWRWRPREVDNADLAFGAVPNLFTITVDGAPRDVVGIGNKDGTYYVIDRDGVNARSGVRWDAADPSGLPYWRTNVVAGGPLGGIIATAAVDEASRRVFFSTAPGTDVFSPQRPTVHALDLDTGAIAWQNTAEPTDDASFAPTSAVPGVVFIGGAASGNLRAYDAVTGAKLASIPVAPLLAAAPAVVDGHVVVGGGVGERSGDPGAPSDIVSRTPTDVTALCVRGSPACDEDQDGVDFPEDCDDRDPRRFPGARELPDSGVDEDCDGLQAARGDACLADGSAGQDRRDLDAVLAAMETKCPCDEARGAQAYRRCTRPVVNQALKNGTLRRRCKALFQQTVCGAPRRVVCCAERRANGVRSCRAVPGKRCADTRRQVRTLVEKDSCAASDCLLRFTGGVTTTTVITSTTTTTTMSGGGGDIPPTWAALHARVINPSCGGCHGGRDGEAGLGGLDRCRTAHQELVGVASRQNPNLALIERGDPSRSWLMLKVEGVQNAFDGQCGGSCGSPMPPGGALLLPAERAALRTWIENGAVNDCR